MHLRISEGIVNQFRPILCIHLSPLSGIIYENFLKDVSKKRTAIAPDTPGYGMSDSPPKPPRIDDYANAMFTLIDNLNFDEIDIIGYGTGSKIAFQMGLIKPEQIKNVILISAPDYTSEEIIQRTIRPAIFDDLWDKFSKCRRSDALKNLHKTISNLNFLDPACGCGNFLITTYIELRRLENAILRKINGENHQGVLDISSILQVSIGQFKGIELDPFAAQIAKVSMWLTEHQMNIETGKFFGGSFVKLPLDANENIIQGDSLALDWKTLADPKNCILIGNRLKKQGARWNNQRLNLDI